MKKFYFALFFALITFAVNAQQQPFVTTWQAPSNNIDITIPTIGSGYNYTIDFGDGIIHNNVTGDISHTYSSPGIYTVSISGSFPRIYFDGNLEASQLASIEQWGDIQWTSMERAFAGCSNLIINATDSPDLSQVTNMSEMFANASSLNQSINNWNVSNVTNMSGLFYWADSFNRPLNNWDVSNVTEIDSLFFNAKSFNQPIDNWNVSNVTRMNSTFSGAGDFNQSLNNWNVSNVTNMEHMFTLAMSFNQALNSWDVSSVTNMSSMFGGAYSFNQPLNNWNVSNVTDMSVMFADTDLFNQPLNNWNVSNVIDMSEMFAGVDSFNQSLNNWDVSSVTSMNSMFANANSFNQPLDNWDVSNVTNMGSMFGQNVTFNQSLNNWNVSNVTNMEWMFNNAISFNQPLGNWDVSNVTNMKWMFFGATSFNQPLNNWDVSSVTSMSSMFADANSFNQPLNNWNVSNVIDMFGMFAGANSFNQNLMNWQFNINVNLLSFLNNTAMDTYYYDAFLTHLITTSVNSGYLGVFGLEYCNQGARNHLINNLGWIIVGDNLSQNCNTITGNILYDENNNGCNPNDIGTDGIMVNIDDGTYSFSTFTNNGNYSTSVSGTSFSVSVINHPNYYTVSPPTATVIFTSSNTQQQDFCITTTQSTEDLNVTLLPVNQARPGFEADYQLVVENIGTQSVANASVTLSFDDTKQSFTSASPNPSATTSNQLTFDIANFQPFEKRTVDIVMQTFTPPTVNGDDILDFTAVVKPNANDNTPNDNTFNLAQTVVNSFDPNDKQVLQGEKIAIEEADEYLNYLIRFQNTGTASAINVRILDTLHPKLDYSTIKLVSSSHAYRVEITDDNHVEFIFENIDLPHAAANEPGSHGFVAYKIKPKSDVQVGDFITGDARIYFDFNAPIITNMVSTEIVENMGINEPAVLANKILVYPNPADKTLRLKISEGINLEKVNVYTLQGQELRVFQEAKQTINIENLSPGMYLLRIATNRGTYVQQVIKK